MYIRPTSLPAFIHFWFGLLVMVILKGFCLSYGCYKVCYLYFLSVQICNFHVCHFKRQPPFGGCRINE